MQDDQTQIIKQYDKSEKVKVTLYLTGGFIGSVIKREVYLLEYGLTDYAQYKKVPYVKYIIKGKRTPLNHLKGYNPFILIVKGWDKPSPEDFLNKPITDNNEVIIRTSRYNSYDERYITDFNKMINPLLNNDLEVIADYRYNKEIVGD